MSQALERKSSFKRQSEVKPSDNVLQEEQKSKPSNGDPELSPQENEEEISQNQKNKVLIRSQALDGSSPPPTNNTLTLHQTRTILKDASGSSTSEASSGLSRDSSLEISTDSCGVDLHHFLSQTLTKGNTKDKQFLLKLETELITFVTDSQEPLKRFPPMSSYQRMLVHRVAAYFGLEHNVDNSGKAVVVNRTPNTRLPPINFSHIIRGTSIPGQNQLNRPKQLLKRRPASLDEPHMSMLKTPLGSQPKSKSVDERRLEYDTARNRIFGGQYPTLTVPEYQQQQAQFSQQGHFLPLQWSSESSGYSTERTTRSSTSNLNSPYESTQYAIWVATSIEQIPQGAIIINPQTASPFFHQDGSVYRHLGPGNPFPVGSIISYQQQQQQQTVYVPVTQTQHQQPQYGPNTAYVVQQQQTLNYQPQPAYQMQNLHMQIATASAQPQPPNHSNAIVLCPPPVSQQLAGAPLPQEHLQYQVTAAARFDHNQMQQLSIRPTTLNNNRKVKQPGNGGRP